MLLNPTTGCGCCEAGDCDLTWHLVDCDDSSPLEGATVRMWNSSAKTVEIFSGATDASGNVVVPLAGPLAFYAELEYFSVFLSGNFVADCGDTITKRLCCQQGIQVVGCNFVGLPGAVVTAYGDAGETDVLDSAITDLDGLVTLDVGGAGQFWFKVSRPDYFDDLHDTYTTSCGEFPPTVQMEPKSGYHCFDDGTGTCALPLPEELTLTLDFIGAVIILTWDGVSAWVGTYSYSYPGCAPSLCLAKTVTLNYNLDADGTLTVSWKVAANCPDPTGGTFGSTIDGFTLESCMPSLLLVWDPGADAGANVDFYNLVCPPANPTAPGTGIFKHTLTL